MFFNGGCLMFCLLILLLSTFNVVFIKFVNKLLRLLFLRGFLVVVFILFCFGVVFVLCVCVCVCVCVLGHVFIIIILQ